MNIWRECPERAHVIPTGMKSYPLHLTIELEADPNFLGSDEIPWFRGMKQIYRSLSFMMIIWAHITTQATVSVLLGGGLRLCFEAPMPCLKSG
jgi:hypothetical protein